MLATVSLGLSILNILGSWWSARRLLAPRTVTSDPAKPIDELRMTPAHGALWVLFVTIVSFGGHHALSHSGFAWA